MAATPLKAFQQIVPFPEAGANSMRSEILLSAFAEVTITIGPEGCSEIVGHVDRNDPVWAEMKKRKQWRRVIAFRVAGSE
jgi:hypothetical protein